ncbi:MAG: hypothetical protein GF398_06655 [Chitinivibrionales bacterium]|nr:hypothetical protein [Chitinivibrionales bacterium]
MAATITKIPGIRTNALLDNPQRTVASLDGEWALALDPDNKGMAQGWAQTGIEKQYPVTVPGCIQTMDELADRYPAKEYLRNTYDGTAWFERRAAVGGVDPAQRVWLKMGGVCPSCHIWVNGSYVGYHNFAMVSFKYDITDFAQANAENRITVATVEQDLGLLGGFRCRAKWTGIYRSAEIEVISAVHLEDICIRTQVDKRTVSVTARAYNDGPADAKVKPFLTITPWKSNSILAERSDRQIKIAAGESVEIHLTCASPDIQLWSCDHPNLNVATLWLAAEGERVDSVSERFGMRRLAPDGAKIKLNGEPCLIRGMGTEYYSPTISPLVDKNIIAQRAGKLIECGFNFQRFHTYVPTDEEMDVADELGFMYCSETGLASNFNKCEPFEAGVILIQQHVLQSRNHPSLTMYCLGNEGSQLMVTDDHDERRKARQGYEAIKKHAPDHIVLTSFGHQGEIRDVPNDIETPHLWSDYFRWSFRGLTDVQWKLLGPLMSKNPSVIHEYGKFTVWPDENDAKAFPGNGINTGYLKHGRLALEAIGLGELHQRALDASHKLGYNCWRLGMEMARRQPGCDGYVIWTGTRNGFANSGFIDDMGSVCDVPPAQVRSQCNGPVAVLIDRDFKGRSLWNGEDVAVSVTLSNFGSEEIAGAAIKWNLLDAREQPIASGTIKDVACQRGTNAVVGDICFFVNQEPNARPLRLKINASVNGREIAANEWNFWAFPQKRYAVGKLPVYDFQDEHMMSSFFKAFPGSVHFKDYDSMVRGSQVWWGTNLKESLAGWGDVILVTDSFNDYAREWSYAGKNLLYLDTGNFPANWYPGPMLGVTALQCEARDVSKLYAPFRSTQDQGPVTTLIDKAECLGDMPHDGFCDLQFYGMIQDGRPFMTQKVFGDEAIKRSVIIRSICKLHAKDLGPHGLRTEDRAYLVEGERNGAKLLASSLRHFDDPAGYHLLGQMLGYLGR